MSKSSDYTPVGKFGKPHGVKGNLNLYSFCQIPSDIFAFEDLYGTDGARNYKIEFVGLSKKGFICRVEGFQNRNDVEKLVGKTLYIHKDCLPELDGEEFYHFDLVGLDVLTLSSEKIGSITAVSNFGAQDNFEIKLLDGKTFFIPFEEGFVKEVSIEKGFVILDNFESFIK